jgi:hypothetical protein
MESEISNSSKHDTHITLSFLILRLVIMIVLICTTVSNSSRISSIAGLIIACILQVIFVLAIKKFHSYDIYDKIIESLIMKTDESFWKSAIFQTYLFLETIQQIIVLWIWARLELYLIALTIFSFLCKVGYIQCFVKKYRSVSIYRIFEVALSYYLWIWFGPLLLISGYTLRSKQEKLVDLTVYHLKDEKLTSLQCERSFLYSLCVFIGCICLTITASLISFQHRNHWADILPFVQSLIILPILCSLIDCVIQYYYWMKSASLQAHPQMNMLFIIRSFTLNSNILASLLEPLFCLLEVCESVMISYFTLSIFFQCQKY